MSVSCVLYLCLINIFLLSTSGGDTYLLVTPSLTWSAAEEYCIIAGGHLASIHSAEDDAEVSSFMQASNSSDPWIGGYSTSTNTRSTYEWSDGTLWNYTNPRWNRYYAHPNFVHYDVRDGYTMWGTHTATAISEGICRIQAGDRPFSPLNTATRIMPGTIIFLPTPCSQHYPQGGDTTLTVRRAARSAMRRPARRARHCLRSARVLRRPPRHRPATHCDIISSSSASCSRPPQAELSAAVVAG